MRLLSRFAPLLIALLAACAPPAPASPTPGAVTEPARLPTTAPVTVPARTPQPTPTPPGEARVRFIHAAPDLPAVTVYAGGSAVATNLVFGQFTEPTTIPAGQYQLRALAAGSRSDASPLLEQPAALQSGEALLIVLSGHGTDGPSFSLYPASIAPLGSGESAVTIISLLADAPASYAVYRDDEIVATPNVPGAAAPIRLPGGPAALDLRHGGESILSVDDTWPSGVHRTLILAGTLDNATVIQFDTRAPGRAALRVMNAAAAAVDVYLGEQLLAANVERYRPTERLDTITGNTAVRVFEAGANPAGDRPLAVSTVTLDAFSTLFVLGPAESPSLAAYPDDLSAAEPDAARITFVDTLEQYPSVRLEMGGETVAETRFGGAPAAITLSEGSHSFVWIGVGSDGSEATIELAEDVQLRAGFSYLYLVTGRTDSPPVVLGERNRTSAAEAAPASGADAALLRLVNALQDQQAVTFTADGVPLDTVEYGQGTALIGLAQRGPVLEALVNGSALAAASPTLESGRRYTVVAYGAEAEQVNLLVIPDSGLILGGDAPHLRLINASLDIGVNLGLGSSPAVPAVENLPEGTDEATLDDYRRSIPGGLFQLVNDIPGGAASGLILLSPGTTNLDLLDSNAAKLATTLDFVELEAGMHYDVIAYQGYDTPRVRGFVLAYPSPPD